MLYPEHLLDEIRQRTDIVDIVSESVQLRRSGKGFLGLCPFHPDKKPSMNVNPDLGIFKCFSCGKGGNVFHFVMSKHGLTFPESIRMLAERAGIPLPEDEIKDPEAQLKFSRKEAAYKVMETAEAYFRAQLKQSSGQLTYSYFIRRGFDDDIQQLFGLGYSPDSWTQTLQYLSEQGFSEQSMEDAGLILRRDKDNTAYDRFRGRAMFPIHDHLGKVIGFGARRMQEDDNQPKYINSPQSLIYDKSRVLYGLAQAKSTIRTLGHALLTEGYADTISLVQAGFGNAVASSGTALTVEQLQLLSRYTKKLFLVYDGDSAGEQASLRGLDLAIEQGFDVRLIALPDGEDPDSFVRNRGPEAFRRAIEQAWTIIQFKIESFRKQGLLDSPAEKSQSIRSLIETVAKIPDVLQHDFYMQQIADTLHLSYGQLSHIYDELRKVRHSNARQGQNNNTIQKKQVEDVSKVSTEESLDFLTTLALPEEKEILRLALTHEPSLKTLCVKLNITRHAFLSDTAAKLYEEVVLAFVNHGGRPPHMVLSERGDLEDDVRDLLIEILFDQHTLSNKWKDFNVKIPQNVEERLLVESLARLRMKHLDKEIEALRKRLQMELPQEEELELLSKITVLVKERHDIPLKFHTSSI
ncbi:MAG: DNA primase [Ignavibacteria bacterium]